jgi:hypothetical protein
MFRNMTSGFDSFDPDNYDPTINRKYNNADDTVNGSNNAGSAGYGTAAAKPGQKMQVNITLNNPTAQTLTMEMFSFLDSMFRRRKTEYVPAGNANYAFYPMNSYDGLKRVIAATDGVVGFDALGNGMIRGLAADPVATIGCAEIAYASFFEASGIIPFQVAYLRQTVTTDGQIDQNITYFKKSFSGGIKENTISPRAYFRPNQFQNKTIDITVSFTVGIDTGIRVPLLAGESVRLAMFIQLWTNQAIS